jgi:hypothetical protein
MTIGRFSVNPNIRFEAGRAAAGAISAVSAIASDAAAKRA